MENPLAPVLVDTIRRLRLARLILRRNRTRYLQLKECLDAAIVLIHERDVELDRLREQAQTTRDELRRYLRTNVVPESVR